MLPQQAEYCPRGLVFVPTYDCTAMCRHCNNDYHTIDKSLRMDAGKAVGLLREGRKLGLNSVQLTGGEITMHPEFMPAVYGEARKLAIRANRPPTNCYIGKDPEKAAEFFSELKKSGYTAGFRISIDPYHNGNIPLAHAASFIKEYSALFKLSSLVIGSCFHDKEKVFEMYELLGRELAVLGMKQFKINRQEKAVYIEGQKVRFGIWKPTRPAWQQLDDAEVDYKTLKQTKACLGPGGFGYIFVEPDLTAKVCSCNGNGFLEFLKIGSLAKETIADVIKRVNSEPIFKILAAEGPAGLRKALNYKAEILDYAKKYSYMCELCNEILGNPVFVSKIRENITS